MHSCLTVKLKVSRSHGEKDSFTGNHTGSVKFRHINIVLLHDPLSPSTWWHPSPPFLSLSPLCVQYDYVTKQKFLTTMFIGGAHLWLLLHNCSLVNSALTYSECKINTG